jgi:hypothetical protein
VADAPQVVVNDEVDPELVNLRRRFPVGPVLALSVLGFSLLLMWRLRADLAYAQQGDTPQDLGPAAVLDTAVDNRFVTLTGQPDAVAPARVRGVQEAGHRLAPFLGSSDRVWLHEAAEAADTPAHYDNRWSGRLRRLADTGFAESLRAHVAAAPPRPDVVFDPRALPDARGTRVTIYQTVPGTARVTFVATDEITDEAAARAALAGLGYTVGAPVESSDRSWIYEVPAAPDEVGARLRAARRFGAQAEPKVVAHDATAGDVALFPDRIVVAGAAIPRAAVDHAVFWVAPALPADVWVLMAGDTPAALWYMRPLYVLLAIIVLLMLWALVTDLRQLRRARPRPQLVAE